MTKFNLKKFIELEVDYDFTGFKQIIRQRRICLSFSFPSRNIYENVKPGRLDYIKIRFELGIIQTYRSSKEANSNN